MLHIVALAYFAAAVLGGMAIIAGTLLSNKETIRRALGIVSPVYVALRPLPRRPGLARVRVIRTAPAPALRLAA